MANGERERAQTDLPEAEQGAPEAAAEPSIEHLLEHVPRSVVADLPPALRAARVVSMRGGGVQISFRGRPGELQADLAGEVDREIIERAMANGDSVLVEVDPVVGLLVVGVIQTRVPTTIELRAQSVVIEAEREILLRAGRAALRVREDGDVELVGSRILTMSRGLFRIVGRVLRLN